MSHSKMVSAHPEFSSPMCSYKSFDELKECATKIAEYGSTHVKGRQLSAKKREALVAMVREDEAVTMGDLRLFYTGLFKGDKSLVGGAMNLAIRDGKRMDLALRLREKLEARQKKK